MSRVYEIKRVKGSDLPDGHDWMMVEVGGKPYLCLSGSANLEQVEREARAALALLAAA